MVDFDEGFGCSGEVTVIEGAGIIISSTDYHGNFANYFYELKNGSIQEIIRIRANAYTDEDGNIYIINDIPVTESEYEEKYNELSALYNDCTYYGYSDGLELNEHNIKSSFGVGKENSDGNAEVVHESVSKGDYIFPNSANSYLSEMELMALTTQQLRIARNEIYARHGYIFTTDEMKQYFAQKLWYIPSVTEVPDSLLNEYEIYNRDLIIAIEE